MTASSICAASPSVLLSGSRSERTELLALRAGPLSLRYEDGGLRYVHWGQREVVRRVYCAVRDADWGTVPDRITNLHADVRDDSFHIEFDVENRQAEIDFAWRGTITGEACGRIVFEIAGEARSAFRKNRIGFCVLHPMDCAGAPVEIRHADGSTEQSRFPLYIAAQTPFLDVVALRHQVEPGVDVALTLEGEVFETEDQRNWIDASFKTFCTPLSRPIPVDVRAGERVFQRVIIELHGQSRRAVTMLSADRAVTLELAAEPVGSLPRIGFSLPADSEPLTRTEIQRIRLLRPEHLRCELHLAGDFALALHRAIATVNGIGPNTGLELALFLRPQCDRELRRLLELVADLRPSIARWIIFPERGWSTTRELADLAASYLRRSDPTIPIGGGTPANFRELNGQPIDGLDFVTWSLTPQCHAFDNASLVETLAAHPATVESARQFAGGVPLVVGPITLKLQVNPYASGSWPPPVAPGQLPPQVDVRQMSLFGAGWTLGSLKYLAESQVQAVTYYELIGWKGLMEREAGSPLPELFPSMPGGVFPMYHVLAEVMSQPDAQVIPIRSSDPLRIEALALRSPPTGTQRSESGDSKVVKVIIANLSGRQQTVRLPTSATSARVRTLDERNVARATRTHEFFSSGEEPHQPMVGDLMLDLLPYAIAHVSLT